MEFAMDLLNNNEYIKEMKFNEADHSELMELKVDTKDKAYEMYNQYAYKIGFGIRRHNYRYVHNTEIIKGREFVCCKEGKKRKRKDNELAVYTKMDTRTNCNARIYFQLCEDGKWLVAKHDMIHNHEFCSRDTVHTLKSHRQVKPNQYDFMKKLVDAGVKVSSVVRFMTAEAGGSPCLGFGKAYAYNALAQEKKKAFDGTDSNKLIENFKKLQAEDNRFSYDMELDDESCLANFLWVDAQMKADYAAFGLYIGVDGTYTTNKYDMVCVTIVGINHHGQNCMLGCGFLLNEKTESYIWLFKKFLECMDGVPPMTIMTDQSLAMAGAIEKVFLLAQHRLCTWHIAENSKNHIKHLRKQQNFMNIFNHVLMYCDSVYEFESFWKRMMLDFKCSDNEWLGRIYDLRKRWCPAYSKGSFSGGALSSQRSESTNKAVSDRLSKTSTLCDVHRILTETISEWRKVERHEDGRCHQGLPEMSIQFVPLLDYARRIYTIKAYRLFEDQYMIGLTCGQKLQQQEHDVSGIEGQSLVYVVWRPGFELFGHQVIFHAQSLVVSCTCNKFSECAILCCHCLRVYNLHSVQILPKSYIAKRWTKNEKTTVENPASISDRPVSDLMEPMSAWTTRMRRHVNDLLLSGHSIAVTRKLFEDAVGKARKDIKKELLKSKKSDEQTSEGSCILNPNKSRKKYERNKRKIGIVEKMSNRARTRKRICQAFGEASNEESSTASFPLFINPSS